MWLLLRPIKDKDILEDKRYIAAKKFEKNFNPVEGNDYSWVFDQAKEMLRELKELLANSELKAHKLITFIGPGSGAIGIGFTLLAYQNISLGTIPLISIGLFVASILISMLFSFTVLIPYRQTAGVSIKSCLATADYYKSDSNRARGRISSGLATSVIMLKIMAEYKSRCMKWSYYLFAAAVFFLIAAIVLAYFFSEPSLLTDKSGLSLVINS